MTDGVSEFSGDRWHLAGSLRKGIGRAWLVTNHGLDDRWGQGPWHQASSTPGSGLSWLREQLDGERGARVPVRLAREHERLTYVYVDRRHIPEDEDEHDDE